MKRFKLEFLFRTVLFVGLALFCWSFLAEAQTNDAPPIVIKSPENHAKFREGTNIVFTLAIAPGETNYESIQFFDRDKPLSLVSNSPRVFSWTNPANGHHLITAKLVYPEQTKNSAPVAVRVNNAALTFGLDKLEFLAPVFMGIPVWQYCASLIYIFLAFYASKIIDFAFRSWLKKWAEKTETKFDDLLVELLHGPVKVIAFVIFLFVGLDLYTWPRVLEGILDKGFRIIVAFSITYTALKAVDMMMNYWRERSNGTHDVTFDAHLFPIISKSLKVFIVVVALLVTWQNLSDKPITAILASLSIGGLAIGLAAQDTLSNFFGAVVVFVDKPFRVGDRIKLPDVDGTVETIGLRSTRVRNLDGHLITVPNKTMGNATITNITLRPNIKTTLNIGISYDTPTDKVKRAIAILTEIYKPHPKTQDLIVSFNQFAESSLNIMVVHWWNGADMKEYLDGMQELNLTVKKRFDDEQISFAFPSRTVYLRQDSVQMLASPSGELRK